MVQPRPESPETKASKVAFQPIKLQLLVSLGTQQITYTLVKYELVTPSVSFYMTFFSYGLFLKKETEGVYFITLHT